MSQEKQDALKGLGATIVRTPTEYAWDNKNSHIGVAYQLKKDLNDKKAKDPSLPAAHVLDQYSNKGNPMAHYEETGQEIWDQTGGKIDYLIAGAGTGGTITGIARKLKEMNPNITIVGVDPKGSILAPGDKCVLGGDNKPDQKLGQVVEGIGYDFIPRVLDRSDQTIDDWIKAPDKESFLMARKMLAVEGFMCGGSCGTAMWGALEYIKRKKIGKDKTVVVVLPDNLRNYMTKHLNDDWMYERDYIDEAECARRFEPQFIENKDWGQDKSVEDLVLHKAHFLSVTTTCEEAIHHMRTKGFDQFPIKGEDGQTCGVLTATNLLTRLGKNQLMLGDPIKRAVAKDLRKVSKSVKLNELVRILQRNSFVLIEDEYFVTFSDIFDLRCPSLPFQEQLLEKLQEARQEIDAMKTAKPSWFSGPAMAIAGLAVGAGLAFKFLKKQ